MSGLYLAGRVLRGPGSLRTVHTRLVPGWLDKLVAAAGERVSVRTQIPFRGAVRGLGGAVVAVTAEGATIRRSSTAVPRWRELAPPVLRGRLTADGDGCRFDGSI